MNTTQEIIKKTKNLGAANYKSKEVVIAKGRGAAVWDVEGREYIDMLSAYSALNFGHCHKELVAVAKKQLGTLTLTSRAFHTEALCGFLEKLTALTGKERVLPMNTGVEAVETALKAARRWGAFVKGVENGRQHIISCKNNFHGRTLFAISLSTDAGARGGYGVCEENITSVPFGDADALEGAIRSNTVAFIVEPIQGEAGVIVPPDGYLKYVREICTRRNILFIADEVQTGFSRTGDMFACMHEGVVPDIYILGKALGGGILPVSAIAADANIMDVFTPGSHGSTFGGNPLACTVASKAMEILVRDDYSAMAKAKGEYFINALRKIKNDEIVSIRGRGLLVGVEFSTPAAPYADKLIANGILCKETQEKTIRFAPPVIISYRTLNAAIKIISSCLAKE